MKKKRKPRKYFGELTTDDNKRSLVDLAPTYWNALRKEAEGNPVKLMEIEARIVALEVVSQEKELQQMLRILDRYNIPRDLPEKWFYLAQRLALISGELFVRPRGAPKKWDDRAYATLFLNFLVCQSEMAREKGCAWDAVPVINVCRRLLKECYGGWGTKRGGKLTAHSLQNRFNEAQALPSVRKLAEEMFLAAVEKSRPTRPTEK